MKELIALEAALLAAQNKSVMKDTNKAIILLLEVLEEDPSIQAAIQQHGKYEFGEYANFQRKCIEELMYNPVVFGELPEED